MRYPMILVAEDDRQLRAIAAEYLCGEYDVVTVATGRQMFVLATACDDDFDVIVADIHLPCLEGTDVIEMIRKVGNGTPVIFITGDLNAAKKLPSGSHVIIKPFNRQDLMNEIRNSLR